jgi:hypothetical protein
MSCFSKLDGDCMDTHHKIIQEFKVVVRVQIQLILDFTLFKGPPKVSVKSGK